MFLLSFIQSVKNPDIVIQIAIPDADHIINGRRLNLFNNQAFNNDIKNLVRPTKIDAWNALTPLPTSYKNTKIIT